ncbi:hypothetical protein PGO05_03675 [Klebsiella aerogenes]
MVNIDLFGFKAKRKVAALEAEVKRLRAANVAAYKVTYSLRQRVIENGMTNAERRFITVCRDIYKHGKMISPRRFHASIESIERDRSFQGGEL